MTDVGGTTPSTDEVANLPVEQRAEIAATALGNLDPEQQQAALKQAGIGVAPADQETSNRVWTTIVISFSAVLVVAVLAIVVISLGFLKGTTDIKTVLTVFTTAAGFLAGLLTPSPIAGK